LSFIQKIKLAQLSKIGIAVSALGLFVTLYDYFISQIFKAEPIVVLFLGILFTINIFRLTTTKFKKEIWLAIIINLIIIIVCFFSCLIILLVFWGYGFMATKISFFPIFAFIICITLGVWSYLEMVIVSIKNNSASH